MAKRKGQNDKQRSTKHSNKTKGRVTRSPLKTGGELSCSGRVTVPTLPVSIYIFTMKQLSVIYGHLL